MDYKLDKIEFKFSDGLHLIYEIKTNGIGMFGWHLFIYGLDENGLKHLQESGESDFKWRNAREIVQDIIDNTRLFPGEVVPVDHE